jgi:virginiamycin B lyase
MPARGAVRRCLLAVIVLACLGAPPSGAAAAARPGCFVGLDVSPWFDRAPSPCVAVDTGGALSGPVAAGPGAGRVTAFAGRQALILDADRVVARAALPAPAVGAAGFSDGSVWFSTAAGTLGRLTPDGGVHVVGGAVRADGDVVEGPGGEVWFASGNGAGRLGADGVARPVSTGGLRPFGLARGPDGAVWFSGGSQVGRLDPDGGPRLFPVDGLTADGGIAAADGALWFTDPAGGRVGRISVDGDVSSWPTNGVRPNRIVAGPDDRTVWYSGADFVGRMQTRTFGLSDAARFPCVRMMFRACFASIPSWPQGRSVRFTVLGPPSGLAVGPAQRLYVTEGSRLAYVVPFRGPLLCGTLPSLVRAADRVQGACSRPNPTFPVVGRVVYVRLSCPRFTLRLCAGTLTLYRGAQVVGRTDYVIHSYDSPTVRVPLVGAGLAARRGRIPVRGYLDAQDQGGLRAARWVSFYVGPHGDGIAAPRNP